jgi:hypothetical protein
MFYTERGIYIDNIAAECAASILAWNDFDILKTGPNSLYIKINNNSLRLHFDSSPHRSGSSTVEVPPNYSPPDSEMMFIDIQRN